MTSPNRNYEDRANESDLKIPPVASSFESKMLENMAAQTKTLQVMAETMVKIHQSVTEQASLPQNCNTTTGDNHSVSSALLPSPFDKERLLAMQAQVL